MSTEQDTTSGIDVGLLLPHFGSRADLGLLRDCLQLAEHHGVGSVWVRDHVLYSPHPETDDPDPTFYEALTTLGVVGGMTERVALGTAALVPLRHPLYTAKAVGSLSALLGRRVHLGIGAGGFDHEFTALGVAGPRAGLVEQTRELCQALWSGDHATAAALLGTDDVDLLPRPAPGAVDILLCGSGAGAARRAAARYDGWMPARITTATLRARVSSMAEVAAAEGRTAPPVSVVALSSLAPTTPAALERIDLGGLLHFANHGRFARGWVRPESGRFETPQDIAGMFLAGDPDTFTAGVADLAAAGVSRVVLDFRTGFDTLLDQLHLAGREVLPRLAALARPAA